MSKTRTWSAGAAVVGVLLIVAAWFLLISPQRSDAASLREQTTQQESYNDQIKLKTQQLKAQYASLPARQAQLEDIKQEMPDTPALPSLVRDLSKYADQADVTLVSVSPTTPAPLAAPSTSGTTTLATPAASAAIQQIGTTVVATGSYAELTLYLQKLQAQMRRALLVNNIQLAKASTDGANGTDLQMTLQGDVFVLDTTATATAASVGTAATTSGTNAS
jgi:type IV pilus assembly protein PilO